MDDPVTFLKSAAARVRRLAPVAPEIADRLTALAEELEGEARILEDQSAANSSPASPA